MKHAAIVSVDLGSAYTKIGVREGWNTRAEIVRGLPAAVEGEDNYCIPSVVAHVHTSRANRWLIGRDAASQIPGDGVRIFRNWKASLFHNGNGSGAKNPSVSQNEAVNVAVAFFTELRELIHTRNGVDVRKQPVRVAVPSLVERAAVDNLMCRILDQAGWHHASGRPTVFEPESNAIGLLSRGKNATWTPPQLSYQPPPGRSLRMQQMLEPGLSSAFRHMRDHYGVLVTDIGAFTTDFGYVKFDSSFRTDDWNRPQIVQQSVELGIRQLDDAVLNVLNPEVSEYFKSRAPVEWERRKRELYAGRPQQIVIRGRNMMIGADFEREAIQDAILEFADAVCTAREEFCKANGLYSFDEEAITGGGSALTTLRVSLLRAIQASSRRTHDLWDPKEPDAATAAGAGRMTAFEKEQRVVMNRMLVRGASALGGASVFFE